MHLLVRIFGIKIETVIDLSMMETILIGIHRTEISKAVASVLRGFEGRGSKNLTKHKSLKKFILKRKLGTVNY